VWERKVSRDLKCLFDALGDRVGVERKYFNLVLIIQELGNFEVLFYDCRVFCHRFFMNESFDDDISEKKVFDAILNTNRDIECVP
jgi:hypothetical protein